MNWFSEQYNKLKTAVAGPPAGEIQKAADSANISTAVPSDVAPEPSGMTTTGGRRLARRRKTSRAKKSKKTLRRKH